MTRAGTRQQDQGGLVLLSVLLFILVTTLAASSLVVLHTTQLQREREDQLLFAGAQFRKAIASYYNTIPPGGARVLPQSLADLLNDNRFPTPVHHLRWIYPDPMTGQADWELIQNGFGVVGIKSRSAQRPIKQNGFPRGFEHLADKERYTDWLFSISLPNASPARNGP